MSKCEYCLYYDYDEEMDYYVCDMLLDEDELYKFLSVIPLTIVRIIAWGTTIPLLANNKEGSKHDSY